MKRTYAKLKMSDQSISKKKFGFKDVIKIYGTHVTVFVHKSLDSRYKGEWCVSHYSTGCLLGPNYFKTPTEAVKNIASSIESRNKMFPFYQEILTAKTKYGVINE